MADSPFSKLPTGATLKPAPFSISVSDSQLDELNTLLKHSRIAPRNYENTRPDAKYGVTHDWIVKARDYWQNDFDWLKREKRINKFPQFRIPVPFKNGKNFTIHAVALFSARPDAPAVLLAHGWPGSFLEFIPLIEKLSEKYTPATLPFSVIAPSLPGYGFSDPPPQDEDFTLQDTADLFSKLMNGLGFKNGYLAQGGDLGYFISRLMDKDDSCRAIHNNMCSASAPSKDWHAATEKEKRDEKRRTEFNQTGSAYAMEHATRPATIGMVLSSNPIALLAWVGEKLLEWTDADPNMDDLLEMISMHWFTNAISTSIFAYRQVMDRQASAIFRQKIEKPFGFSYFPREIMPVPKEWIASTGNLAFYREHETGGHFAAWEKPGELLQDIEDFVTQVWHLPDAKM